MGQNQTLSQVVSVVANNVFFPEVSIPIFADDTGIRSFFFFFGF